MPYLVR